MSPTPIYMYSLQHSFYLFIINKPNTLTSIPGDLKMFFNVSTNCRCTDTQVSSRNPMTSRSWWMFDFTPSWTKNSLRGNIPVQCPGMSPSRNSLDRVSSPHLHSLTLVSPPRNSFYVLVKRRSARLSLVVDDLLYPINREILRDINLADLGIIFEVVLW